jgi:DNA modification methylase/superfamily II DNA or RNA helicase
VTGYDDFLASKRAVAASAGRTVDRDDIHPSLFEFQRAIVQWAVRKGRCAIFADTGLGKTFMQLEWARLMAERTLIVAPLSVARQTVNEAHKIGLNIEYVRRWQDATGQLSITNYEMLDHFEAEAFGAVVLDESSILKAFDGKTRAKLTDKFADTPYRLACTATPAPNDIAEIGNHAEFLGIMAQNEMLAAFFVHGDMGDGERQGWRLKGHAHEAFYRWLASWGMSVRTPSDLGFSDEGYVLPPLKIEPQFVKSDYVPEGQLFFGGLKGITDRSAVRKATIEARVAAAAELVNADSEQWIVWHGLNDEGERLAAAIPGSVLVEGSQSPEAKAEAIERFQDGQYRVLVTKPRIAGFGMNFQNAHQMAFVGLSDSWEAYYQCIRRCYRFGQSMPVTAHVVLSDAEEPIYTNVMRKETEARQMQQRLIDQVARYEMDELDNEDEQQPYEVAEESGPGWRVMLGDSAERLATLPSESVDLTVYSPPFLSLYTYSPSDRDMGNSRDDEQFWTHYSYVTRELLRLTKPGRHVVVHCAQVPRTLGRDGVIGIKDFRGDLIRHHEAEGWVYHGEVCIDKDPQAQAIRTKNKGLLFVQKEKDRSWLRPAFADYLLVFRKPGDNGEAIRDDQITNDEWIQWARPIWYGIRESETLNAAEAREHQDERHIAPLQLETLRRAIRLWSNPGETVLDPFSGIGSTGYVAVQNDRQYIGVELKPAYWRQSIRNLSRATTTLTLGLEVPA